MLGAGKGQTGAQGSFPGVEVGGALRQTSKSAWFMAFSDGNKRPFSGLQKRSVQLVRKYTVCYIASRFSRRMP
jgi:hypothetical protein